MRGTHGCHREQRNVFFFYYYITMYRILKRTKVSNLSKSIDNARVYKHVLKGLLNDASYGYRDNIRDANNRVAHGRRLFGKAPRHTDGVEKRGMHEAFALRHAS